MKPLLFIFSILLANTVSCVTTTAQKTGAFKLDGEIRTSFYNTCLSNSLSIEECECIETKIPNEIKTNWGRATWLSNHAQEAVMVCGLATGLTEKRTNEQYQERVRQYHEQQRLKNGPT